LVSSSRYERSIFPTTHGPGVDRWGLFFYPDGILVRW
jgi:hypothetical protein